MLGIHYNTLLNMRKRGVLTDVRIPTGNKNAPRQGKYLRAEIEAMAAGIEAPDVGEAVLERSVTYTLGHLPHHHSCALMQEPDNLPCTCWKHQLRNMMMERLEEKLDVEPQ